MEESNETGDVLSSLTSLDDFTHLSVDKFMSSSFTKSQYNQVIFHDLSDVYPTDSDIKCSYRLTDNVRPQAGDKIAIFKVGWVSVSDYITFVRAPVPEHPDTSVLEVVFIAGTFPKKDNELYQLCYVTSGNVIAGASTPFSFHKLHESELIAVEDPTDPGLVVFRSRVAQLQSDLEKQNQERETILSKYHLLEERYNILKKEFDKNEYELINLKKKDLSMRENQELLDAEKKVLEESLNKYKEEICTLNQEKNCYQFAENDFKQQIQKEQIKYHELKQQLEIVESQKQVLDGSCQKLGSEMKSLHETIQLLESDKKILQEKLEKEEKKSLECASQVNQVSLEEYQEKLFCLDTEKMKVESILQEKERLEFNLREQMCSNDNLMLEIGNLTYKLKEMSEKQNKAMAEAQVLKFKQDEADEQFISMKKEIEEQRKALEENSEHGSEYLKCKEDRNMYLAQFENLQIHHSKCEAKTQMRLEELRMKYELQITELNEQKTALKKELQQKSSGSGQKTPGQIKDPASQLFEVFTGACAHVSNVLDSKVYKSSKNETDCEQDVDMDKQLKEKVKMLLNQKAELSENLVQEKHKTSEMGRLLVEIKEENAALKSRINVLEYELATIKNSNGNSSMKNPPSPAHSLISEQLDSLNKNIPVITEFNKIVAEQKVLEQKIQEEKTAKIILQSKVEFLLQEDAKMSNKLQEITEKYEQLRKEKDEIPKSIQSESVEVLQKVLEDNDEKMTNLQLKFAESIKERDRLNHVINGLRNELVGKISVDNLAEYKLRISQLEKELQKKIHDCKFLAKVIQDKFTDGTNRHVSCPICNIEFPSSSREAYVQHFDSHIS